MVLEQLIPGQGYGHTKNGGRIDVMEEQIAGVHGEMAYVEGDLQRLGPLEVKVDSMLEKLSFLERMVKMMQRWEPTEKGRRVRPKKKEVLKGISTRDPNLGAVTTPVEEGSFGMQHAAPHEGEGGGANPVAKTPPMADIRNGQRAKVGRS